MDGAWTALYAMGLEKQMIPVHLFTVVVEKFRTINTVISAVNDFQTHSNHTSIVTIAVDQV